MKFFKYIVFFLLIFNTSLYSKTNEITIAYQNTISYPFLTGNSNTTNWDKPGALLEMMKLVEKKIHIKIVFKRVPWKRGLFELKSGEVDALLAASYKKERLDFGVYPTKNKQIDISKRTHYNSYYLYKIKNAPTLWDGKTFTNVSKGICVEREYSIVSDLRKNAVLVHEFNSTLKCMDILNNDRVDAVAALEFTGDYIIKQTKYKNIVKVNNALKTKVYHMMMSHKFVNAHPKLSELIWDTIEKVRESQEMKNIYNKYLEEL